MDFWLRTRTSQKCSEFRYQQSSSVKLIRTIELRFWFYSARNLRAGLNEELDSEGWQNTRIFTALVITGRECEKFFTSESGFYRGVQTLQQQINAW